MAASRPTYYRHIDGTVSTRNSKTRVYAWAVEQTLDLHAEAISLKTRILGLERDLESFKRAVATNKVIRNTKPWGRGATYRDFFMEDPTTGERHWIGAESEEADGTVRNPFDGKEAVAKGQADRQHRIDAFRKEAQELSAGPRYSYGIVRWSERRDSADKAVKDFRTEHATYKVVEAVEGKPEAIVEPTPEPEAAPVTEPDQDEAAMEKALDELELAVEALEDAQEPALDLTDVQGKALAHASRLEASGEFLINNVGTSVSTVRALARMGLMTVEEGWDTPWGKTSGSRKVWLAKLTEAGRTVAAHLAKEPQEAAQDVEPAQAPKVDSHMTDAEIVEALADLVSAKHDRVRADADTLIQHYTAILAARSARAVQEAPVPIDPKGVRLTLGRAGFAGHLVRRGIGLGGYSVVGKAGVKERSVPVSWRAPDSYSEAQADTERARMLNDYADALEARGYTVELQGRSLIVSKHATRCDIRPRTCDTRPKTDPGCDYHA